MEWLRVPISETIGRIGLMNDGDWIISENMDNNGDIRLIQLADIGIGEFLNRSSKFITSQKLIELNCTELKEGDILISRMANPIGRACIFPKLHQKAIAAVDVTILRPDPNIADNYYIMYLCNTQRFLDQTQSSATGTTRSRITRKNLEKILTPLPPLSEQKRIVDILGQVDEIRKKRIQADAISEGILPALFIKMFGDPSYWDSSNIKSLGDLVKIESGGTPSKKREDYWDGNIPWVSPKDIKTDIIYDSIDHITQLAIDENNLKYIDIGAILIVVRGMILSHTIPIAIAGTELTINQDTKALIINCNDISSTYLCAVLKASSKIILSQLGTEGYGTRKLDTEYLLKIPVLIPSKKQLEKFEKASLENQKIISGITKIRNELDQLFQTLLYQAFSGELTAKWRQGHLSELLQEMEHQTKTLNIEPPKSYYQLS
jgi:type I restriction enzyme S subunit